MIEDKLNSIFEKIRQSENMSDENKESVLQLLSELKEEISDSTENVSSDIQQNIKDIDHEDEGFIQSAFNEMNEKLVELEESHPKLVSIVNSICTQLSNSGI